MTPICQNLKCKFRRICLSRRWCMLGTRANVLRRRCRTEVSNKPIFASCREKQYSMPLLMVILFCYVTLNNFVFAVSSRAVVHSKWRRRQMIWPRYRSIQTVRIGYWQRSSPRIPIPGYISWPTKMPRATKVSIAWLAWNGFSS